MYQMDLNSCRQFKPGSPSKQSNRYKLFLTDNYNCIILVQEISSEI